MKEMKEMVGEDGVVVKGEDIAGAWAKVFKKVVVEMKGEYTHIHIGERL